VRRGRERGEELRAVAEVAQRQPRGARLARAELAAADDVLARPRLAQEASSLLRHREDVGRQLPQDLALVQPHVGQRGHVTLGYSRTAAATTGPRHARRWRRHSDQRVAEEGVGLPRIGAVPEVVQQCFLAQVAHVREVGLVQPLVLPCAATMRGGLRGGLHLLQQARRSPRGRAPPGCLQRLHCVPTSAAPVHYTWGRSGRPQGRDGRARVRWRLL
jgi:hypothetical protein